MTGILRMRVLWVWLLLMAATLLSLELFLGLGGFDPRLTGSAIIAIAFVKVRLVGLDFMELRTSPRPLRIAFELWVVAITAAIIGLYWTGGA